MNEVNLTRVLPASRERVWAAFTSAETLAAWFWPEHFATRVSADVRVGGAFAIEAGTRDLAVSGEYVAVDRPHLLSFTWRWRGDDEQTQVTITLTELGSDRTELALRHERFTDDDSGRDSVQAHAQGWSDCLSRLLSHVDHGPGVVLDSVS